MSTIEEIIDSLKHGKTKRVTDLVKIALEDGIDAQVIVEEAFLKGMEQVGEKFRNEEVGMPEILSVTRALDRGVEAVRRYGGSNGVKEVGTAVIGTMEGDVHDIGKNLVKMMLLSKNIHVIDLGVDVSPRRFVEEAMVSKAKVVCLSGILGDSAKDMREVVEAFEDKGCRKQVYIMVGGYFMNEEIAKEIGADVYTENASACAEKAYQHMMKKEKKKR